MSDKKTTGVTPAAPSRPSCLRGTGVTKVFGFGETRTVAVDHVDLIFMRARSSRSLVNPVREKRLFPKCCSV